MATYNLTKKTNASTGQQIVPSQQEIRLQNLENKVTWSNSRVQIW